MELLSRHFIVITYITPLVYAWYVLNTSMIIFTGIYGCKYRANQTKSTDVNYLTQI